VNYDEFFAMAESRGLRVESGQIAPESTVFLSNEALFQLPLLAMVIMILAKGHRKPMPEELGQLVGECLERAVAGFKGSPQGIGWSANLRIRTVKALTFLEIAGLVTVPARRQRITLNELGKKVVDRVLASQTQLALALATIERSYQNIAAETAFQARLI
jgi:hypothetical protein